MNHPNFIILYVDNCAASAAFYARLLDLQPVESSPNFALFKLNSGMMLGLWARAEVAPAVTAAAGGVEVVFDAPDRAAVEATHRQWQAMGLAFAQPPVAMEFGYTFVALDPEGHRLRVYCPEAR